MRDLIRTTRRELTAALTSRAAIRLAEVATGVRVPTPNLDEEIEQHTSDLAALEAEEAARQAKDEADRVEEFRDYPEHERERDRLEALQEEAVRAGHCS